tara:strand:+ start:1780 stop:2124 length:345 start_codon:yes stop_codon:yes gene_type:complete
MAGLDMDADNITFDPNEFMGITFGGCVGGGSGGFDLPDFNRDNIGSNLPVDKNCWQVPVIADDSVATGGDRSFLETVFEAIGEHLKDAGFKPPELDAAELAQKTEQVLEQALNV